MMPDIAHFIRSGELRQRDQNKVYAVLKREGFHSVHVPDSKWVGSYNIATEIAGKDNFVLLTDKFWFNTVSEAVQFKLSLWS